MVARPLDEVLTKRERNYWSKTFVSHLGTSENSCRVIRSELSKMERQLKEKPSRDGVTWSQLEIGREVMCMLVGYMDIIR